MLNLSQRLILGCVLLACLTVGLVAVTHKALAAAGQVRYWPSLIVLAALLVEVGTVYFVLRPIHMLARDAHRIAQGNLEHRVEWSSRDDFGVIASELNRLAVRLRELRDTEAGRRQMEFQLSDAVLQSIFEPIIVTDGKGHVLKVNQAAAELLGEAATDRMALTNTPGGDKILSAIRDAVSMQKAVAAEDEASMLPMRIGKQERSYRLRTTPMRDSEGRLLGTVTTLEDVTSLQDTDRFKTQFITVASRKLRDPLLQLRRGLYALNQGFGGELRPLQAELVADGQQRGGKTRRPDERPDRSGRARHRQARVQAGAPAAAAGAGTRPATASATRPPRSTSASRSRLTPISPWCTPTAALCAPSSTTCSPTHSAIPPPTAKSCWPPKRSRTLSSSPCATPAAALRPSA